MEEQRIYDEEDDANQEALIDAVWTERGPLEKATLAREATSLVHFAMLVIELRWMEKRGRQARNDVVWNARSRSTWR